MSNLLDKASIILTPTAYSEGVVHTVKPDNSVVDGDFEFDRGTLATRTNANGEVVDVNIIGSELVQNGNFEELGSELVTNGGFDTDSDWTLGDGWSIQDGVAKADGSQTSTSPISIHIPDSEVNIGSTYKLTLDVLYNEGTQKNPIDFGSSSDRFVNAHLEIGTHTFYVKKTVSSGNIFIYARNGERFEIDNVSVREVDPNERWTLGTGWSIEDGKLSYSGVDFVSVQTSTSIITAGKKYRLTLDAEVTSGSFKVQENGVDLILESQTGSYSVDFTAGTSTFTIARAGFGVQNDFSIDNISVKEITDDTDIPRINYEDGTAHILLEPESTNLIPYSEDFSQWLQTNTTITLNQGISPDGNNNANRYVGSGGSQDLRIGLSLSDNYTYSCYVKAVNSPFIRLRTMDGSCWFDMTNNTVATNTFASANIQSVGNDWYRISVTSSSFTVSNVAYIHPHALDNTTGELDGGEFLLWGAQLEEKPYATSYIPTNGGTATRAAETLTGGGDASLINSEEGVLFVEMAALADDLTRRRITLSDGTTNNRVNLYFESSSNRIKSFIKGGGSSVDVEENVSDITDFNKIAVKYKSGETALWINGVEVDTTSGSFNLTGLDRVDFSQSNGTEFIYGKVKQLVVFPEALTDAELQCLTS